MAWTIVTEEETASYCRVVASFLRPEWYTLALGAIENYTGWYSLDEAETVQDYFDGSGSSHLRPLFPINSVTSIQVHGITVPAAYYYVKWNAIQMRSYRPDQSYATTLLLDRETAYGTVFPYGMKNIYVDFNVGGTASLPAKYLNNLRLCLLMIIKEFTVMPRGEGSDYKMNKWRPDRTLNPEEVLTSYGVHGKINGIIRAFLPRKKINP